MKWTVIYQPPAQDDLADASLSSPDPQAVADAADEIDRILASNSLDAGESRGGDSRIIIKKPLTVLYDVYPDEAVVEVSRYLIGVGARNEMGRRPHSIYKVDVADSVVTLFRSGCP